MHQYKIREMLCSHNLIIEFFASPENPSFREAITFVMGPHGFETEFDGHYFYAKHPDSNSTFSKLSVSSDEWGVIWGDADPWGSKESNLKLMAFFDEMLSSSGKFVKVI